MFGIKRPREEDLQPSDKKQYFSPPPIIRQPATIDSRENVSYLSDQRR